MWEYKHDWDDYNLLTRVTWMTRMNGITLITRTTVMTRVSGMTVIT